MWPSEVQNSISALIPKSVGDKYVLCYVERKYAQSLPSINWFTAGFQIISLHGTTFVTLFVGLRDIYLFALLDDNDFRKQNTLLSYADSMYDLGLVGLGTYYFYPPA